jgi:hypothetical protein
MSKVPLYSTEALKAGCGVWQDMLKGVVDESSLHQTHYKRQLMS